MHRAMAKVQASFLHLVYFSVCVFSLELDTILPYSSFLSPHSHPPNHGHHHHHPHAPAKPPTHHYHHHLSPTPTHDHPPHHHSHAHAKPPTHHIYTPSPQFLPHPPAHPIPSIYVAVQGVVYAKSCKHAGADTLLGATALFGAIVKLECNITKNPLIQTVKTNNNGYFYIETDKSITTNASHKCKVFLVSAPNGLKPSNFHGGLEGAILKPKKPIVFKSPPFFLYNVESLAFEPICPK
ncbi:unnamed protein product [Lupinus luteus]|uniref:Uncharacterized protein n=1 Tax=Lupinus luteus TaxID=3873 RepID=A0AAV1WPA1_LUPLU